MRLGNPARTPADGSAAFRHSPPQTKERGSPDRAAEGPRGPLGQGEPRAPGRAARASGDHGPRRPGEGMDPGAASARAREHRRADRAPHPVPRARLAAAPREGRAALPQIPRDPPHVRHLAAERRREAAVEELDRYLSAIKGRRGGMGDVKGESPSVALQPENFGPTRYAAAPRSLFRSRWHRPQWRKVRSAKQKGQFLDSASRLDTLSVVAGLAALRSGLRRPVYFEFGLRPRVRRREWSP